MFDQKFEILSFPCYYCFFCLVNVTRVSPEEIRQKELSLERQLFKRHEEVEIKDAKVRILISI